VKYSCAGRKIINQSINLKENENGKLIIIKDTRLSFSSTDIQVSIGSQPL
jgi:hypothetical protein